MAFVLRRIFIFRNGEIATSKMRRVQLKEIAELRETRRTAERLRRQRSAHRTYLP